MKNNKLISLNLYNDDCQKRIVFGGKTINLNDAYKKAIIFALNTKIKKENITINKSIHAILPNCEEILNSEYLENK
jgi:hypothetical protein